MLCLSMENDRIIELTLEMVRHIRRPEYLYGSRRWGWITYIHGDLELEASSTRSEYLQYSVTHPEFLLDYLNPTDRMEDEQLWFEGDIEALEQEVIWLRLST